VLSNLRLIWLSSTKSRVGIFFLAVLESEARETFSMAASVRDAGCAELSATGERAVLSAGMERDFGMLGLVSIAGGNGNSACFSASAFGVGLSMALRALALSAAIRVLSSTSPPRGDIESSSKTLLRSVLSGCVAGPSGPGVIVPDSPSRHWVMALASLRGPTGLATNPTLHWLLELRLRIES
jgi:hypothetical protein